MYKHGSQNIIASLSLHITEEEVAIKLIHPGSLLYPELHGAGKSMIEKLVRIHNGAFISPRQVGEGEIETTIIVKRW